MKTRTVVLIAFTVFIHALAYVQTLGESTGKQQVDNGSADANQRLAEDLLERGLYFSDLYNWLAARPYLIRAQKLFKANEDKRNALYAELAAIRTGVHPDSLPERSFKLGQQLEADPILRSDKELRMFCLIVKGELDGDFDNVAMRRDWTEVSELARELNNQKWTYRALGQLGFADFYDGDLPGAQKNVAQALVGAATIKDVGGEIFYLSTMATGLVDQGMSDQALQYADRALAIAKETPDAGYPIIAEEARLMAMVNSEHIDAAKAELKNVLLRSDVQSSHGQLAQLDATAAKIAEHERNIAGAIEYLTAAVREARMVDARKVIPGYESGLSNLYRLSGDLPKAEELANEAAASFQQFGFIPVVPQYLHVLAQIQVARHEYREADQTYDRAAAIQDAMIGNSNSELGKSALVKGASDMYAKHFSLIAEHMRDEEKAFSIVEQVRGRVITDLLESGGETSPESIAAEKNIARLRLKLMSARSNREVEHIRDAIFLVEQSRSITPELSILKSKEHQRITIAQLRDCLVPSESVLEYVIDDPSSYALIITKTGQRVAKLPAKETISRAVTDYLKEVKAKHAARAEARELHKLLLQGIPEVRNKKQLVIVRDGPLHLVPFDALIDARDRYVLESQNISYAPSATSFYLLRAAVRSRKADRAVLAVGGVPYGQSKLKESAVTRGFSGAGLADLPSSGDEARAVIQSLPDKLNILLIGNDATETAFKKATNHGTIHLAIHAIANEKRADHAALVFLSDPINGEDGFLEASEIVQLHLNADLVVLSACDTAVGPVEGEEGISTLSRAFLLAGARTVVSTLWSIDDDSTLYLMRRFYKELAGKYPPAQALRIAKQQILTTFGPEKALPYYWAAFTVEGLAQPPIDR